MGQSLEPTRLNYCLFLFNLNIFIVCLQLWNLSDNCEISDGFIRNISF